MYLSYELTPAHKQAKNTTRDYTPTMDQNTASMSPNAGALVVDALGVLNKQRIHLLKMTTEGKTNDDQETTRWAEKAMLAVEARQEVRQLSLRTHSSWN